METNNYLDALKARKLKDIKVATSNRTELMKKQDNKCSKCKQPLRAGYYKFVKDPKTEKMDAVCSGCLIHIPERR